MRLKTVVRDACDKASPFESASDMYGMQVRCPQPMRAITRTGGFEWRKTVSQFDARGRLVDRTVGTSVTWENDPPSPKAYRHAEACYVMYEFTRGGNQGYEKTLIYRILDLDLDLDQN